MVILKLILKLKKVPIIEPFYEYNQRLRYVKFNEDITEGLGCTKTKDNLYVLIYNDYATIVDVEEMTLNIFRNNSKKAANKRGFKEIKNRLGW